AYFFALHKRGKRAFAPFTEILHDGIKHFSAKLRFQAQICIFGARNCKTCAYSLATGVFFDIMVMEC
ncbi:MAG: hypothetical protein UEW60_03545, partial [Christensenellales bacterium]|nr:hypothetical protein [Christensenellales bacterium]